MLKYCESNGIKDSFSRNHTCPYSCIGLQQLNLLYHYNPIYSHTAYLSVVSSSNEGNESNAIDYGAIAKTINEIRKSGVTVELPYINEADVGFKPDVNNNGILFSLKGITGINTEVANMIIQNRPYSSFEDFMAKTPLTKVQMINLIKSGAFDKIEPDIDKIELMKKYLLTLAMSSKKPKEKLTGANLEEIFELGLVPAQDIKYLHLYNYNKAITKKENEYEKIKNKTWLIAKGNNFTYFEQNYIDYLQEDKDYYYSAEGIVFSKAAYNKLYKGRLEAYIETLNTPEFITRFNSAMYQDKINEDYKKYCQGSMADWEMNALSFYYQDHPLATVNNKKYNFSSFKDLPSDPIIEDEYEYKGKTFYKYRLSRICGTVLDNNRTKHTVTLLTSDNDIVTIKFWAGQFINYNKKITDLDENGKSVIRENSWFTRGTKLAIVGYRRDDQFIPKVYKNSIYNHSVSMITNVDPQGNLSLQSLRYGETENHWRKN